ncbi:hypothetical protein [Candidatus Tisiphia endosymbiont of Parasteatoda lunata]|uniref:hypothetical protein n=1 Tax=Candidatus Tisiphia endosymbiont of Parasteatoda lunata TaxID=3066275 RepID=UPI00313C6F37
MMQSIDIKQLSKQYATSEAVISTAIEELIQHGFLKKVKNKKKGDSLILTCPDKKLSKEVESQNMKFIIK